MIENFPRIAKVVQEAPVDTEVGSDSLSIAKFVETQFGEKYKNARLDELPENIMREAITEIGKSKIRGSLAPAILLEYPNGEAFASPELQKLFELLDGLVDASFDVSLIINNSSLRTTELDEDEKIKLNQVSKTMAELIGLTGYDTKAALKIKTLFVESMLHGFDVHKYRNLRLQGSSESSGKSYLKMEARVVEQLQRYLDVWMRGAVDIEIALQQATKEISLIKSTEVATPEDDVKSGVDFWLTMDLEKIKENGNFANNISKVDKLVLGGRMAVQVKSRLRDDKEKYNAEASAMVRKDDLNSPQIRYCRSVESKTPGHYQLTVDIETSPADYAHQHVSYQGMDIVVSQLKFEKVIPEIMTNGDIDKIPEMIFNKHATFRRQYEARKIAS